MVSRAKGRKWKARQIGREKIEDERMELRESGTQRSQRTHASQRIRLNRGRTAYAWAKGEGAEGG